jgi:hypothetical protein
LENYIQFYEYIVPKVGTENSLDLREPHRTGAQRKCRDVSQKEILQMQTELTKQEKTPLSTPDLRSWSLVAPL